MTRTNSAQSEVKLLPWPRYLRVSTDGLIGGGMVLALFSIYAATLLPGLGRGDTAELQRVVATLRVAHSTGYPLYTLLGWLWIQALPVGTPAWALNLFSALAAALAAGTLYGAAVQMGQQRVVALSAAAALGVSRTFWQQATMAEVYALASLLSILLIGALLAWRAARLPLWVVGLLAGLNFAHHRVVLLLLPGVVLFVLLARMPRWRELLLTGAAATLPVLLYLYIPWRAPPGQDGWLLLHSYLASDLVWNWLDPARLWAEGWGRPWGLLRAFVLPQFTLVGVVLGVLGVARLLRRDRALAALLLLSYAVISGFCSAYYIPDIEVFLFGVHLIHALLLGEGAMLLLERLPQHRRAVAAGALLALPAALFALNLGPVLAANTTAPEIQARRLFAQPLEPGALLFAPGHISESLHYLQAVEGQHPAIELRWYTTPQEVVDALTQGRTAYVLRADPASPADDPANGTLVRLPPTLPAAAAPTDVRWQNGLQLTSVALLPRSYEAGAGVPLLVTWEATAQPARDYVFFVHIVDAEGDIVGQHDHAPVSAPTSSWQPGTAYTGLYVPLLKEDTPPGHYRVLVGWYTYPELTRLPLVGAAAEDAAMIGEMSVAGVSSGVQFFCTGGDTVDNPLANIGRPVGGALQRVHHIEPIEDRVE